MHVFKSTGNTRFFKVYGVDLIFDGKHRHESSVYIIESTGIVVHKPSCRTAHFDTHFVERITFASSHDDFHTVMHSAVEVHATEIAVVAAVAHIESHGFGKNIFRVVHFGSDGVHIVYFINEHLTCSSEVNVHAGDIPFTEGKFEVNYKILISVIPFVRVDIRNG